MSKRFSFHWRVLAHFKDGQLPYSFDVYSKEYEASHSRLMRKMRRDYPDVQWGPETQTALGRPCEFDELVIGDWFHLEQMHAQAYWMRIGGYHIWVREEKGKVIVTHDGKELSEYGLRADE